MSRKMYIAQMGILTPLGHQVAMMATAVAAGINVYDDSPYLDQHSLPVRMALVPQDALPAIRDSINFYGSYSLWQKHLLQLASSPLTEALAGYSGREPIPLLLATPETYADCPQQCPDDFIEYLAEQTGTPLCHKRSRLLPRGRAGGLEALELAASYLFEGNFDEVLIGGVDSYQNPDLLRMLLEQKRIAGIDAADGFTPGEGAGFIRLTRHKERALNADTAATAIYAPGFGLEAGHLYSDEAYLGEGLSAAVTAASRAVEGLPMPQLFLSANGERYWAKEVGTALTRNRKAFSEDVQVHHPAEFYGDLGAATAPVLIALAAHQQVATRQQSPTLVCCSSDHTARAAVAVLTQQNPSSAAANDQAYEQKELV